MNFNSISTFASLETRQRQISDLQVRLQRAGQEMATGQVQDPARALGPQTEVFESLSRSRSAVDQLLDRNAIIEGRLSISQSALDGIAGPVAGLAEDIASALGRQDEASLLIEYRAASSAFQQSVTAFNSQYGDRFLFAGSQVDRAPLGSAATFTQEIGTAVTGAPDIASQLAAVDALFDGGMAAPLYVGDDAVPEADIAFGERLQAGATANDPQSRPLLQGLAMLAALDSGDVALTGTDRDAYVSHAISKIEEGETGLVDVRAQIGFSQARIADANAVHQANRATLDLQINGLVGVDPYEAASEFQALESQLQASYLVVSRLSSLSLTNYLR